MDDQAPAVEERVAAALAPQEEVQQHEPEQVEAEQTEQVEAQELEPAEAAHEETPEDSIALDPDAKVFEVEIMTEGGQKVVEKLSLNELKAQRMMQADYQRKTQEVAKERSQAQEAARQQVAQVQGQYLQNLQTLQTAIQQMAVPEMRNVDLSRMAQEDPTGYVQLSARLQQYNQVLSAVQQEMGRVQNEYSAQQQEVLAQAIQQANEDLPKRIPGWNTELYHTLLKAGVEQYGFKADEVGNIVDPRQLQVLHDAFQFRKLQNGKAIVEKKVVNVPKVIKPGTPADQKRAHMDRTQELRTRLRKSEGKDEDALIALVRRSF